MQHGSHSTSCVPCPPLWFLSFLLSVTLQTLYFRYLSIHLNRYHGPEKRPTLPAQDPHHNHHPGQPNCPGKVSSPKENYYKLFPLSKFKAPELLTSSHLLQDSIGWTPSTSTSTYSLMFTRLVGRLVLAVRASSQSSSPISSRLTVR